MTDRMRCSNCGHLLAEGGPYPPELSGEGGVQRSPCPKCGSTARTYENELHGTLRFVGSVSARLVYAWNSDRLAVLLFLLGAGLAVGLAVGFAIPSVALGIASGLASMLIAAFAVWAVLRGPLSRLAAKAMYEISGR
jgi:hypothetical protein